MFVAISKYQQRAAFTFFDLIPSEIRLVLLVYLFLETKSRNTQSFSRNHVGEHEVVPLVTTDLGLPMSNDTDHFTGIRVSER